MTTSYKAIRRPLDNFGGTIYASPLSETNWSHLREQNSTLTPTTKSGYRKTHRDTWDTARVCQIRTWNRFHRQDFRSNPYNAEQGISTHHSSLESCLANKILNGRRGKTTPKNHASSTMQNYLRAIVQVLKQLLIKDDNTNQYIPIDFWNWHRGWIWRPFSEISKWMTRVNISMQIYHEIHESTKELT